MTLLAPYYLQVGDLVIEDGTGTGNYSTIAGGLSFPEPSPDGYGGHLPATRTIEVRVTGTTSAALSTNIATLRRECVRDKRLHFSPDSSSPLSCRIRDAHVTEASSDPLRRVVSTPVAYLTLTIETDPYWEGDWTDETDVSSTVTTVPGHFDVTGVPGEVGALVRLRAVPSRWGFGLAVGIKYDPATGYDYLDDYGDSGDTSNASALGTYREDTTMTGTAAVMGTTPTLDTNGNRGRHLVLARMMTDATPAAVSVYMNTTTTGSAIADSVTVDELAMALPQTGIRTYELGTVQIPAGQVPDIDTGTGYTAPAVDEQQTTENASTTYDQIHQTVTLTKGTRVSSVVFKTGTVTTDGIAVCRIYSCEDDVLGTTLYATSGYVAFDTNNTELSFSFDWLVPATGKYTLSAWGVMGDTTWRKNTAGGYASGDLLDVGGSSVETGQDAYFKVYTRIPLTFDTTTAVMASCSESSKTLGLDYVQRIPLDDAAIVYRRATNGAAALLYDGDTDTPYVADADGIGPAVYDKTEIRKPLRFAPGVTNRVVLGILQNSDSVQGWSALSYSYRPRYLTATGGDAS